MGKDIFAQVIVDVAHSSIDKIFEYKLQEAMTAAVGVRVMVPFGRTKTEGIVLSLAEEPSFAPEKIKEIEQVLDLRPVVNEDQIRLAEYICARYKTTMAFALRLMYPAKIRRNRIGEKRVRVAVLQDTKKAQLEREKCFTKEGAVRAKNRLKTIDILLEEKSSPTVVLDAPAVRYLQEQGIIDIEMQESYRLPQQLAPIKKEAYALTQAQKKVTEEVNAAMDEDTQQTFLLHGVTGSGKTEVYIACVKHALAQGKTAIVLVPEISITPQMVSEFARHFPTETAVFHSGLSDGERYDEWRRVRNKEAKIVLGARSAVFMPLEEIGLIVVDEAHAESYKAENHPPYHAVEIANMRSRMWGGILLLGSATPLIEDYAKAQLGIYKLLELPERVGETALPKIQVVDMKKEYMRGNRSLVSGALQQALSEVLEKKEQALLFLNRRGYASGLVCTACGHARMCSHCDIPLKYHKGEQALVCHHCGRKFPLTNVCPACGEPFMRLAGAGTQKVEEQIKELFPDARTLRMDFDTTRKKGAYEEIFKTFRSGAADILIGTQMIGRGLDFDQVTLAAIIAADSLLLSGDYRQEERAFSMMEQVGGRAGRKRAGKVIIQTFQPEHYAIEYATRHDYKGFYAREIAYRKATKRPPFSRVFRLLFTHANEQKAKEACEKAEKKIAQILKAYEKEVLLFVAKPAPIEKLDGKARYHIMIKVEMGRHVGPLREELYEVFADARKSGVLVSMDINPYDIN
ncbi:MAG: replication restart helicase PriA [Christensenellaceae bacterium]|jgi:primosomal protein N' (replication factor Y)